MLTSYENYLKKHIRNVPQPTAAQNVKIADLTVNTCILPPNLEATKSETSI